jgi:hypothetical protein
MIALFLFTLCLMYYAYRQSLIYEAGAKAYLDHIKQICK